MILLFIFTWNFAAYLSYFSKRL